MNMRKLTEDEVRQLKQLEDARKDKPAFLMLESGIFLVFAASFLPLPRSLSLAGMVAAACLFLAALVRMAMVSFGKAEPRPGRYVRILFYVQVAVFLCGMLASGIADGNTPVIVAAVLLFVIDIVACLLQRKRT